MDKAESDQTDPEEHKIELSDVLGSNSILEYPSAMAFGDKVISQLKNSNQEVMAKLEDQMKSAEDEVTPRKSD